MLQEVCFWAAMYIAFPDQIKNGMVCCEFSAGVQKMEQEFSAFLENLFQELVCVKKWYYTTTLNI